MAWVNFRATLDRFRHIDAELVRSTISFTPEGGQAEVVIKFYPWWEHPLYEAARIMAIHGASRRSNRVSER